MTQRYSDSTSLLAARSGAERWLARFAPVLEISDEAPASRLKTLQALRKEGEPLLIELSAWASDEDQTLLTTLREALEHVKDAETVVRAQVAGTSAPLDLNALREKIAEAAARTELGESVLTPQRLVLALSRGSWGAAGGIAAFALFWNGFTLVHATFMIGGMWRAFGPLALFLLLFYSLFFGAGFVMAKAALDAASQEEVRIEGSTVTVRKTLGRWVREKVFSVGPQSRAGLELPTTRAKGSRAMALVLNDTEGKTHQFGVGAPEHLKSDYVRQLNSYLSSLRS